MTTPTQGEHAQTELAHELFAAAQLAPGEGIEDAVSRIAAALATTPVVPKVVLELPAGDTRTANVYWSEMRGDTLHLCISVDPPAQPAAPQGVAYAELPEPIWRTAQGVAFSERQLYDFADRTHALRASNGQAPAGGTDPDGEAFRAAAHLGLTLRFYGGCAQSGMPGTPSAYEVVAGGDRAAAMREAVQRAAAVIENGGESQRLDTTAQTALARVAPRPVTAAEHEVLMAAVRDNMTLVAKGRLVESPEEQAAPDAGAVAGPSVFGLKWPDDERINLSTIFDTEHEANEFILERCRTPGIRVVRLSEHPTPAAQADSVLEDAARWNEVLMHVGAANHLGGQHFTLNTLRIRDQMFLLRGSVAQHFTACIDDSRAARKQGGA